MDYNHIVIISSVALGLGICATLSCMRLYIIIMNIRKEMSLMDLQNTALLADGIKMKTCMIQLLDMIDNVIDGNAEHTENKFKDTCDNLNKVKKKHLWVSLQEI